MTLTDRGPSLKAMRAGSSFLRLLAATAIPACCMAFLLLCINDSTLTDPPPTSLLDDREGNFLCEAGGDRDDLGFWTVESGCNPLLEDCIIAMEDRRFREHGGVDPVSILRALGNNLGDNPRQGASTIAMQTVRLQRPADRTFPAKMREAVAAFIMTARYGRDRVMAQYLRMVPQGNRIRGVGYASVRYFRKPVEDLGLAECAVLSTLARFPGRNNLFSWKGFESSRKRARMVMDILRERGDISPADWEIGMRQLADMQMPVRRPRVTGRTHFILRALEEDDHPGTDASGSHRARRTSLDPQVQKACQDLADKALEDQRALGAGNLAIVVADRSGGKVRGYVGSQAYFDQDSSGAINYARTPRSSGSTLKPFLYARGLDTGDFTAASILADLPFAVLDTRGEYRVRNFDNSWLGPLLYRKALANSRNTPALRVLATLGVRDFLGVLRNLGLERAGKDEDWYGYGMAIGGVYVTLEDLVAAYGTLGNDGHPWKLAFFEDAALPGPEKGSLSPEASRQVLRFLSDNEARTPSFPRLNPMEYPFPVAVKTGTSQGFRDAWAVCVTDRYVAGIWMGNPDNRTMNHVAGMTCAAYLRELVTGLQPDRNEGVGTVPFPGPEGWKSVEICPMSGKVRGPWCPSGSTEFFPPGAVPRESCDVHRLVAVDRQTGNLAGPATPPERIAMATRTFLPPEYGIWASRNLPDYPKEDEGGTDVPVLDLSYPDDGSRFFLDPDTPRDFQTLPLQVTSSVKVSRIRWLVDGQVVAEEDFPYECRWPLVPGVHRIQAVLPDGSAASRTIRIVVE